MDLGRPLPKQLIPDGAKKVFTGKIFDTYQWPQQLYDGTEVTFEVIRRPDSINILPITNQSKIVLTKQEQPGMEPFIGALGGRVDKGETLIQAAERELLEEAGLRAGRLELWNATHIAEKLDWVSWTFIAKNCSKLSNQQVDGGEKIELIEVTFDEYMEIVAQDTYRDTEIALELLRLSARGVLDAVRKAWLQ
ncbi:NUDIX hydrolase [candidate division TM7 genomosp. GTL1]|nr:NUDIX hydrolase [candidate division TM7 genomosp. GTL1]